MTGGVPSVSGAEDAFPIEVSEPGVLDAGLCEAGLDAAAVEGQFEHSQLKTHEMQAVLARAVEAGEFDGADGAQAGAGEKTLLSVLAVLEAAKDRLDRVRLRA